jgi:hypothetical protein
MRAGWSLPDWSRILPRPWQRVKLSGGNDRIAPLTTFGNPSKGRTADYLRGQRRLVHERNVVDQLVDRIPRRTCGDVESLIELPQACFPARAASRSNACI